MKGFSRLAHVASLKKKEGGLKSSLEAPKAPQMPEALEVVKPVALNGRTKRGK